MNKKLLAVSLATVLAFSTVGCNKSDSSDSKKEETTSAVESTDEELAVQVDTTKLKSEYYGTVKLADYSEFVVYESEINVSDELVQEQIDGIMSSGQYNNYVKTDETEAVSDSVANIDYVGYIDVDGEDYAFQGGSAEGYDLDLANSTFIDGFAEGVVGMKVGDTKDVNITFPDGYGSTQDEEGNEIELSNKPVRFEVTLNYISKNEGLTDDFVNEQFKSLTGATNIKEFEQYFRDFLLLQQVGESGAFEEYVEKCEFTPNEETLQSEYESNMASFQTTLEEQSLTMEDYLEQYQDGKSAEDFEKEYKENLQNMLKTYAVICALGEDQGIEVSQARFNELFGQIAAQNQYDGDIEGYISYYEQYYGTNPLESFPIQFMYQDVMHNTIKTKLTATSGERPTEAETESAE